MSDQPAQQNQAIVQPEDPQFQHQEHVKYRHRQQVLNQVLHKIIAQNLSQFKTVMNGTQFAYTCLKLRNSGIREITDVIKDYQHLRTIDLSYNALKQIAILTNLKYLVKLQLIRNLLTSASFLSKDGTWPYLKQCNLQGNKITNLPSVALRSLRRLNLNNNVITTLQDFQGHPTLEVLELRGNKIKSLKGLKDLPSLAELYIAQNQLTELSPIQNAPSLHRINARKNKIANLSQFPNLPSLMYLNLRQNQIAKVNDLTGVSQTIKNINLLANPIQAQLADNTKKQVWMRFRNFNRINKNQVTNQEREEFDKEYRDRLAEQERERLEKQAAEREAREAQEKQKQG